MPICPKCKTEYRTHIRVCPDCGSTLVEGSLEEPAEPTPEDEEGYEQVLLCVTQGEIPARLLQNALAQEGIPSRIQVGGGDDFGMSFPAPFAGGTATLMEVWVNKRDLDRAQAVRQAYDGEH